MTNQVIKQAHANAKADISINAAPKVDLFKLNKGDRSKALIKLLDDYITKIEQERPATTVNNFKQLRGFVFDMMESYGITHLDDQFQEDFIQFLLEKKKLLNSSCRVQLERLITMLNYFNIKHTLRVGKMKFLNFKPQHEIRDEILTDDEIERAFKFNPRSETEKIMVLKFRVALYTGFRYHETATTFIAKDDNGGDEMVGCYSSKNQEPRFVPLHPRIKPLLDNPKTLALIRSNVPQAGTFKNTLRKIGIKGEGIEIERRGKNPIIKRLVPRYEICSFHSGRKTFAVRMIESGMDVYPLSKLLGHDNMQTTLKYYSFVSTSKVHEQAKNIMLKWK